MFIRNRIIAGGVVAVVAVALGGASWALADNGVGTQDTSGETSYGVGEGGGSGFPARYAAPYVETWGSPSELERVGRAGLRYVTLAFVLDGGECRATFNGDTPVTDPGWLSAVEGLRASGGDVIASFGGASGTELGQGCSSVSALQEQYRTVVDALGLSRLDFDIEGGALADSAANHRRNQALVALQKEYAAKGRTLDVQFTLPSGTKGLEQEGVAMLQDAESTGLEVKLVNIMTMDYGSGVQDMGQAAIDAATGLHEQLGQIWTSKSPEELWAMEGNTPMIGVNDTPGEVFTTDDATRLESFAEEKGIQQLSFWAVGRDKACADPGTLSDSCSGTEQSDDQFSRIFNAITTTTPTTVPSTTPSRTPGTIRVPGPAPKDSATPVPAGSGSSTPDTPDSGSGSFAADPGGAGRTIDTAFTTGYTWFDNTPRGSSQISNPVMHQQAGGTGTYADPITLAVGHSLANGKDTLDYPAGTRFYLPRVRRYFIVEDTCGDGGSPQNGPCHSLKSAPEGATTWLDMYIGGAEGDSESAVQACADKVTAGTNGGLNTVVQNPGPNLPVVEGPVFQNGKCTDLYTAAPTTKDTDPED